MSKTRYPLIKSEMVGERGTDERGGVHTVETPLGRMLPLTPRDVENWIADEFLDWTEVESPDA